MVDKLKDPVWDVRKQKYDSLRVGEAEKAMGWPVGHTTTREGHEKVPEEERLKMVGNGFNVATVAAILAQGRKETNEAAMMNNKEGQKQVR